MSNSSPHTSPEKSSDSSIDGEPTQPYEPEWEEESIHDSEGCDDCQIQEYECPDCGDVHVEDNHDRETRHFLVNATRRELQRRYSRRIREAVLARDLSPSRRRRQGGTPADACDPPIPKPVLQYLNRTQALEGRTIRLEVIDKTSGCAGAKPTVADLSTEPRPGPDPATDYELVDLTGDQPDIKV